MGTNFYWRDGICVHCGRFEEIHVGKSSGGWSFGFRGYRHELINAEYPDWGYEPSSPFGFPIVSRTDWRRVFIERVGELWDEYGRRVDENPEAWLDRLEPPDAGQQAREWSREWMGPHWRLDPEREWRDTEGFRFYQGEFS